jgi:hypothetical protein
MGCMKRVMVRAEEARLLNRGMLFPKTNCQTAPPGLLQYSLHLSLSLPRPGPCPCHRSAAPPVVVAEILLVLSAPNIAMDCSQTCLGRLEVRPLRRGAPALEDPHSKIRHLGPRYGSLRLDSQRVVPLASRGCL